MKFIASSNNNTIVTVSEFLGNPHQLIKGTIERDAFLIILDDDHDEQLLVMHAKDFYAED